MPSITRLIIAGGPRATKQWLRRWQRKNQGPKRPFDKDFIFSALEAFDTAHGPVEELTLTVEHGFQKRAFYWALRKRVSIRKAYAKWSYPHSRFGFMKESARNDLLFNDTTGLGVFWFPPWGKRIIQYARARELPVFVLLPSSRQPGWTLERLERVMWDGRDFAFINWKYAAELERERAAKSI